MINSKTTQCASTETTTQRANMTEYRLDLPAIVKQVRLCRSTLGAVLDELECANQSPDALDLIEERTMSVSAEIESLWAKVKQSQ